MQNSTNFSTSSGARQVNLSDTLQSYPKSAQQFSAHSRSLSALEKLSDKELFQKCQIYGAEARKWTRKFAALLPEVGRRQLYKKHGFYSIFEFAAKLAGMRRETVVEILRVAKKLEDKPLLLNKLEEQGVNKLRLVVNIATKENQTMLAEKIETMSKATLATFIQEKFRAGTELNQNNTIMGNAQIGFAVDEKFIGEENSNGEISESKSKIPQRITISIPFEPNVELRLREFQKKLSRERKSPVGLNEVVKILLEIAAEKSEKRVKSVKFAAEISTKSPNKQILAQKSAKTVITNPPVDVPMQDKAISRIASSATLMKPPSRYIPTKIKQFLHEKFAGRCAWPGCIKLPEIFHHTLRFALNPTHDPDHIVPLCKNHERLAHYGLIENEEKQPENWKLKFEPNKNALKYGIDQKVVSLYAPKTF